MALEAKVTAMWEAKMNDETDLQVCNVEKKTTDEKKIEEAAAKLPSKVIDGFAEAPLFEHAGKVPEAYHQQVAVKSREIVKKNNNNLTTGGNEPNRVRNTKKSAEAPSSGISEGHKPQVKQVDRRSAPPADICTIDIESEETTRTWRSIYSGVATTKIEKRDLDEEPEAEDEGDLSDYDPYKEEKYDDELSAVYMLRNENGRAAHKRKSADTIEEAKARVDVTLRSPKQEFQTNPLKQPEANAIIDDHPQRIVKNEPEVAIKGFDNVEKTVGLGYALSCATMYLHNMRHDDVLGSLTAIGLLILGSGFYSMYDKKRNLALQMAKLANKDKPVEEVHVAAVPVVQEGDVNGREVRGNIKIYAPDRPVGPRTDLPTKTKKKNTFESGALIPGRAWKLRKRVATHNAHSTIWHPYKRTLDPESHFETVYKLQDEKDISILLADGIDDHMGHTREINTRAVEFTMTPKEYIGPVENPTFAKEVLEAYAGAITGPRAYAQVTLAGVTTEWMLVDYGAAANCITEDCLMDVQNALGDTIPRVSVNVTVRCYGASLVPCSGGVVIPVRFGNGLAVHVPFLIIDSETSSRLIMGTQFLLGARIGITYAETQVYLTFRDQEVDNVRLTMMGGHGHLATNVEAVCIAPGDRMEVKVKVAMFPHGSKKSGRTWDKQKYLMETNPELGMDLKIEEIGVLDHKGRTVVHVRNNTDGGVVLPPGTPLVNVQTLTDAQVNSLEPLDAYVDALEAFKTNYNELCLCQTPHPMFLTNSGGYTGMGVEVDMCNGTTEAGIRMKGVVHINQNKAIIVCRPLADIDAKETADLLEKAGISNVGVMHLLYSNPAIIDDEVIDFMSRLRAAGVRVVFRAVDRYPDGAKPANCLCHQRHLPYVIDREFGLSVGHVNVHLILGKNSNVGKHFRLIKCGLRGQIRVRNLWVNVVQTNLDEISLLVHLGDVYLTEKTWVMDTLLELFAQVKPLMPRARVRVTSDADEAHGGTIQELVPFVTELMKLSEEIPDELEVLTVRDIPMLRPYRRPADAEYEFFSLNLNMCGCDFCQKRGCPQEFEADPRRYFEAKWPGVVQRPFPTITPGMAMAEATPPLEVPVGLLRAYNDNKAPEDTRRFVSTDEKVKADFEIDDTHLALPSLDLCVDRKFQPEDPLVPFLEDLKKMSEETRREYEFVLQKHSLKVISYDKRDFQTIHKYEYVIQLTDRTPFFSKRFPMSRLHSTALDWFVFSLCNQGVISPYETPMMTSNCFLVNKNSDVKMSKPEKENADWGKVFRMVVDLRELNKRLLPNRSPKLVRSVDETLSRLQGYRYFTTIDIKQYFYSLRLRKDSLPYMCISDSARTYCFRRLLMGCADSPNISEAMLRSAIREENREQVVSFMDDIIIMANSHEEMRRLIDETMEDLELLGVHVSAEKMKIARTNLDFLGHQITSEVDETTGAIRTYKSITALRKEYIQQLETPHDRASMARFLGILAYCSNYLDSFGMISALLYPLVSKKGKFQLDEVHVACIEELKKRVAAAPRLYLSDPSLPMVVTTDGSFHAWGGVFTQRQNGKDTLLHYASGKFTAMERRNLSSMMKELVAILRCLQSNKMMLTDTWQLVVQTDMRALVSLYAQADLAHAPVIARHLNLLSSMSPNLVLRWKPNTDRHVMFADYLSRLGAAEYHAMFSTKFKSSNELTGEIYDIVDTPDEWKLNGRNITIDELVRYSTEQTPIVTKQLEERRMKDKVDIGALQVDCKVTSEELFSDLCSVRTRDPLLRKLAEDKAVNKHEGLVEIAALTASNKSTVSTTPSVNIQGKPFSSRYPIDLVNMFHVELDQIVADQRKDEKYGKILEQLGLKDKTLIPKKVKSKYLLASNGLLLQRRKGGVRVMLPKQSCYNALGAMHLVGHLSRNILIKTFRQIYTAESVTARAEIIVNCCRACRMLRVARPRRFPGILNRAMYFHHTLACDHFWLNSGTDGTRLSPVLVCCDVFSKYLFIYPVKSETAAETIRVLTTLFSTMGIWRTITSDLGTSLVANKHVRTFCESHNVSVRTGAAFVPYAHGVIESMVHLARKQIMYMARTMDVPPGDVVAKAAFVINNVPRQYNVLDKDGETTKTIIRTPYQIVFGNNADVTMNENTSPVWFTEEYIFECRDRLARMMAKYYNKRLQEHREKEKDKFGRFHLGQLILIRKTPVDKNAATQYKDEVFKITRVMNRTIDAYGIFQKYNTRTDIQYVKEFVHSEDLHLLSDQLKRYYGPMKVPDPEEEFPEIMRPAREEPRPAVTRAAARRKKKDQVHDESEVESDPYDPHDFMTGAVVLSDVTSLNRKKPKKTFDNVETGFLDRLVLPEVAEPASKKGDDRVDAEYHMPEEGVDMPDIDLDSLNTTFEVPSVRKHILKTHVEKETGSKIDYDESEMTAEEVEERRATAELVTAGEAINAALRGEREPDDGPLTVSISGSGERKGKPPIGRTQLPDGSVLHIPTKEKDESSVQGKEREEPREDEPQEAPATNENVDENGWPLPTPGLMEEKSKTGTEGSKSIKSLGKSLTEKSKSIARSILNMRRSTRTRKAPTRLDL